MLAKQMAAISIIGFGSDFIVVLFVELLKDGSLYS